MFATKDWKLIQQQRRVERQTDSVRNGGPLFSFKQSEEFEALGLGKNKFQTLIVGKLIIDFLYRYIKKLKYYLVFQLEKVSDANF